NRRAREREAAAMRQAHAAPGSGLPDWQPLLDEEVSRLPRKYRVAVVLCYLEGKTHDEAARQLGWPLGTGKGRLARARDPLRARLGRRGLALSAAALTAALDRGANAAVPAALTATTLQAVLPFSAGEAIPAGVASAQALTLAKGALQSMTATRFPLVLML